MDQSLSVGAVSAIYNGVSSDDDPIVTEPTLQVLSIKKVSTAAPAADRYRLILSDGVNFMQSMLATQLNPLIAKPETSIDKNTVIKLNHYACNHIQGRVIVIVLSYDRVFQADGKIGEAVNMDSFAAAQGGAPPAQAAAPAPVRAAQPARKPANKAAKDGPPIFPIESLSPYQNKWTIKARVSSKSEVRHWTNAKGEGKLFSVNLLDDSGEIKATGFNSECDSLYDVFQEGKVFLISKARVNVAKKQFSNLSNEYEIMFDRNTEVTPCDDQDDVPQVKYTFAALGQLSTLEKDATCDILGVVQDNGRLDEITSKASQKQIKKRDLTICDTSGYSCRLTLWGRMAESWVDSDQGVFVFKGAKVGDFGGRTLSMGGQSTLVADPDIPEAHKLRGWYDTEGKNQSFTPQSSGGGAASAGAFKKDDFKTLDRVEIDQMGYGDKAEFFSARATIVLIKSENLSYPACPTDKCNKKVTLQSEDEWRCEKCDRTYPAPEYRYIMSMCVADHTTQQWISAFNEAGEAIIGKTANEMNAIKENDGEEAFAAVVTANQGKMFNFSMRAKAETFGDNTRVKCTVQRLAPVDFVEAARDLLAEIEKY